MEAFICGIIEGHLHRHVKSDCNYHIILENCNDAMLS